MHEPGDLVRAFTPHAIATLIERSREDIRAAFAAGDDDLARLLVRRNVGYRLCLEPRTLSRRLRIVEAV